MKKYKIKIKNPKKEGFIIRILNEFGLIEEKPNYFTEKEIKKVKSKPQKIVKK